MYDEPSSEQRFQEFRRSTKVTERRRVLVLKWAGDALVQISRRIKGVSEAEMAVRCFNYAEAMADEAENRGYLDSHKSGAS